MKFSVSIQGKLYQNCFPAQCKCINFSLHGVPVQDFLSYPQALAGYFFSKSPSRNPFSEPLSICITSKNQFYQQDMIESSHSHSKELLSLIFSKHFIKKYYPTNKSNTQGMKMGTRAKVFLSARWQMEVVLPNFSG